MRGRRLRGGVRRQRLPEERRPRRGDQSLEEDDEDSEEEYEDDTPHKAIGVACGATTSARPACDLGTDEGFASRPARTEGLGFGGCFALSVEPSPRLVDTDG